MKFNFTLILGPPKVKKEKSDKPNYGRQKSMSSLDTVMTGLTSVGQF